MIGSGLTMIDVALELRSLGHRGRLIGLSRHGGRPQVHFNDERLQDDNSSKYLPTELPQRLNELFHCVRQRIKAAEMEREGNWRLVINELRPLTHSIWRGLSGVDRKRFMRHVRQLWDIHRHRMAPEIDAKIQALIRAGRLSFVCGRIVNIEAEDEQFNVFVKERSGAVEKHTVQQIINCTGPQTDLRRVHNPLVNGMMSQGMMVPDELGLSPMVDAAGRLLGRDGRPVDANLFAVGPLRRSELWESIAVPELREQARELAQAILQSLDSQGRARAAVAQPTLSPN
jgi:uncharacterized NAD(P)/FAD-binding protein YdhS